MADFENKLNIICLESEAFYTLIDQVVERMVATKEDTPDKWISDEKAMQLLHNSGEAIIRLWLIQIL